MAQVFDSDLYEHENGTKTESATKEVQNLVFFGIVEYQKANECY